MKIVYLRDEQYNWQKHEYEGDIEVALKPFLEKQKVSIGYGASIGDRASIGYGASIGYRASIGKDVKLITGLYLTGSKHPVTYVGEGKISIGCHCKEITWWKKNYKSIGEREGYSKEEIKEYSNYIKIAELFFKSLPKIKK